MRISFVIPALNEREGVRRTLERIPKRALEKAGHAVEVLVIDGASKDGTADEARGAGAKVIVDARPGYGRAYKTGFAAATGDVVITGDADGTYPFEDTLDLLRTFESGGYGFLTADRFAHLERGAMSGKHRFGNWVLTFVTRILFGIRLRDSQSGMWVISRNALQQLPYTSFSDKMPFSEEIKIRAMRTKSIRAVEVPGSYRPRIGEAKLSSWKDGWRNLKHLVRLRLQRTPRQPST
jgi:glycosyltransferase involved in cell wall biosynthesis